jgi:hypothetical protein
MKRLIQWSIDHHWMVIAMSVILLGAGVWIARDMPVDVFPDLTAPTVTILTEAHGMAPEEMEALVTFPIEAAINGASGVRRVRSATAVGVAVACRVGRIRLGDGHLHRASDRGREDDARERKPATAGGTTDSRADLLDHGGDSVLRDLFRCR